MVRDRMFSIPVSQKRQASMKHRYIFFSTVLFLIAFCVGNIAFVTLIRPIVRENIRMELMWYLEREWLQLVADLNSEIAILQKMADSPLVRQYLMDPADSRLRSIALEDMAAYRNALAPRSVFWISDRDKRYHFGGKYLYTLNTSEKSSEWYDSALNMTSPFQLKVNFDIGLQKTMLWIDVPVFDNRHTPIGLVGIGMDINIFVKDIYKGYHGNYELYVFNADGEITGTHDIGLIENKVNMADVLGQVGTEILKVANGLRGTSGINYFEIKDKKTAIAIDSIPILDWYMVAVHHFTLKESLPIGMTVLFALMMMTICACLVVLNVFVVRMLKPFNYLVKVANQALLDWELKHHMQDTITGEIETIGAMLTMTIIDPLTNIYNRRYMDGQLKKIVNSLSRSGDYLSLFLVDVDYFKKYNDTYGHDAGDNCLREIASAMSKCMERDGDFIARYGGEEFAVILPHTNSVGARLMADKLLKTVLNLNIPNKASDTATSVTISIGGISGIVHHSQHPNNYFRQADKALYESKKGGRNRYTLEVFE
jgi:diguanylate cyclase (GGDEF)-like protein